MKLYKRKFYEMANISKQKTGLDFIIWIMYKTNKEKHGPRIKIKINNDFVPITISNDPELKASIKIDSKSLNKIKKFILINKDILLKYWDGMGDIGIDEILNKIKKV